MRCSTASTAAAGMPSRTNAAPKAMATGAQSATTAPAAATATTTAATHTLDGLEFIDRRSRHTVTGVSARLTANPTARRSIPVIRHHPAIPAPEVIIVGTAQLARHTVIIKAAERAYEVLAQTTDFRREPGRPSGAPMT